VGGRRPTRLGAAVSARGIWAVFDVLLYTSLVVFGAAAVADQPIAQRFRRR
jgi:hypothetical protein